MFDKLTGFGKASVWGLGASDWSRPDRHGLGVLEASCSALAARSLRNSSTFRLPGIGEPSAAILMRPNLRGPTGRISGFFTQVQFGPPMILLWVCSGMSPMAGPLLLAAGRRLLGAFCRR